MTARIEGLLGVQELPEPWLGMIGILYLCAYVSGDPVPDMRETDAAQFFHVDQLDEVKDSLEPLSEWLALRVLSNHFKLLESNDSNPFAPSIAYV